MNIISRALISVVIGNAALFAADGYVDKAEIPNFILSIEHTPASALAGGAIKYENALTDVLTPKGNQAKIKLNEIFKVAKNY